MEVILKKDVDNLGAAYTLVKVKPGYARNYLIPKGLAITANASNRKMLANILKHKDQKQAAIVEEYKEIAKKLTGKQVKIGAKVGTTEKIFGSITTHHLAEAIKKQLGVDIDRKVLHIADGDIKTLGTYKANIVLADDIQVDIDFEVVAE